MTLCVICTVHMETRSTGFLVEPENQGRRVSWLNLKTKVGRFFGLVLKTDNSNLVIYASKSLRQFLRLNLKTKRYSVYWLRHKTDRGRSTRDTRRDLAVCFA
jgi:hypothetical protein